MSNISNYYPDFGSFHPKEIEQVIEALSKITSRSPEEIKPYLNMMLNHLAEETEGTPSFYETASYEEWMATFHDWVASHKGRNLPLLNDEAISRESIYKNRY
ncbi:hypothetical protein IQ238_16465 [Pleurocapsales cyanobacterium LEGE 06147]|nr:hypothetical protein [Pleurocapsales cyanobacterium LEGE 06147]